MTGSKTSTSGVQRLHDALSRRVAQRELPGVVWLIAHGNAAPTVEAIGTTRFDTDQPMQRDAIFRIASLTKPVLGAATMMLVEEGTLRLDDPVEKHLPELAHRRVLKRVDGPLDDTEPARRSITVEDLMTFKLGYGLVFDGYEEAKYPVVERANELQLVLSRPDPRSPLTPDEWIARFATLPLMYQPGERWMYNIGTLILGVLVARASGKPLGTLLRERIFDPLGMHETGFFTSQEKTARIPGYYMNNTLQSLSLPEEWAAPPAFPSGSGGLLSTIDDFHVFGRWLLNKGRFGDQQLLSVASVERMTTNHLTPEQIAGAGFLLNGEGWGYGMAVAVTPDDVSLQPGRYGWSGGYGTAWFNDPHRDLTAIAMTQTVEFLFAGGLTEFEKLAMEA